MMRSGLQRAVSATALLFGLSVAGAAGAQQAPPPNGAPKGPSASTVGEVVITAERRVVSLQRAPVSATVVSGAELQQKGVYDVDELQFITPSLTVTNYGIGEDYNIRGIGKEETNIQTPSGIIVYRDGVATFPGFFTQEPYYDIASVEVLRGPQGTFAGQNATGGAIFVTEIDPVLNRFQGWIEGQYGSYDDVRLRGAVNIPVSDTLAIRLAGNLEREDSFYTVTGPHAGSPGRTEEADGRVSVLWTPTPALDVLFKNDFNYIDLGGLPDSPIPIPKSGPPYPQYASAAGLFDIVSDINNYNFETFDRSVLKASYTFGDGIILRSITGYQIGRLTFSQSLDGSTAGNAFYATGKEQIGSEELNLLSPDSGPLKWIVGGYYQSDDVRIPLGMSGFDIHTPPLDILLDYNTPKTTAAGFGQLTWEVTDQFEIVGGARYTHSTFTLNDTTEILLFGLPGIDFKLPPENAHAEQTDDAVTAKIDFNWRPDDRNFFYAFVANGHKPGGINTTPVPFGPGAFPIHIFSPENLIDYEAGWKSSFAERHLRTQLDVYYTTYRDFQLSYTSTAGAAPGQSIIQNVPGATTIYGVEGQVQAVFGDLSFDASADYLHSRLGSAPGTCTSTGGTSPSCLASGLVGLGGPATGVGYEDIGGVQQPYAPPWNVNFDAQYAFHLAGGSTLTPRLSFGYVDAQWTSPFQAAPIEQYLYRLAPEKNLNAQIAWDDGPNHVTLYGTNLLDDHYFAEDPGANALVIMRLASPPLQYGIRVARDF